MLLLASTQFAASPRRVVAIFGVGLIGGAVKSALYSLTAFREESLAFTWVNPVEQANELGEIARLIAEMPSAPEQISVLWSAGRGGFMSTAQDLDVEFQSFVNVLGFTESLARSYPSIQITFHLVSSAGGLFEGQSLVNNESKPAPQRPYGELKLKQEDALLTGPARIAKRIYRPSSVYGFAHEGKRAGLISVILQSGIQHRVLSLVGNQNTLRDFVFSRDIGQFIAAHLLDFDTSVNAQCFTLASGRPTSIHEIQEIAERVLRRKVYFVFSGANRNAADITYSPRMLPEFWEPVDIATGIRLVHQNMQRLA